MSTTEASAASSLFSPPPLQVYSHAANLRRLDRVARVGLWVNPRSGVHALAQTNETDEASSCPKQDMYVFCEAEPNKP